MTKMTFTECHFFDIIVPRDKESPMGSFIIGGRNEEKFN